MSDNEIKFCDYFEKEMLPNRNKITTDMVREAASFVGYKFNGNCRSCLHDSAIDLLNLYNRMKPNWELYKKSQNEIHTKYEETILDAVAPNEIKPEIPGPKSGILENDLPATPLSHDEKHLLVEPKGQIKKKNTK